MKDPRDAYVTPSITAMMYSWSKWDRNQYGLVKEELDEWACQVCGEMQTSSMPSYMYPMDDTRREFIRVCSACKRIGVEKKAEFAGDLLALKEQILEGNIKIDIFIHSITNLKT